MSLQFLFSAALYALPLAGLPLILHLLFRQKAQVIPFSTLRFIHSSLKQNAARRRIQRWLLLACRALLLALLIWALAQPARKLTAGLLGGGTSTVAAIVVDTSYSMMLEDQQRTLLANANDAIQDLLRNELRDAQVAIFRSAAPNSASAAPMLAPADSYRGEQWAALRPTPSPLPLADRIAAAADLLAGCGDENKCLFVLTDAQTREFPRPLPRIPNCRTILIDLHPPDVRTAAVTDVHTDPSQPRLGIPAQVAITLSGHPGDVRQAELAVSPAGEPIKSTTPLPLAHFDATGRADIRVPFAFADASWLLVTGHLTSLETLPWAESRSTLVRVAPRQLAAVLPVGRPNPLIEKMIRLALDPSEGQRSAWPVSVHAGPPKWDESLLAVILNQWPDAATIQRLTDFAQRGGSLVLFVQPGLEASWPSLEAPRQQSLAALLPSAPQPTPPDATYRASFPRPNDPILSGISDTQDAESRLVVTRLVRFNAGHDAEAIFNAVPIDPQSGASLSGLLWRRRIGFGSVFTWATLPDRSCGNLLVWDLFPPALVNAAATPPELGPSLNVEIGQPISLPASAVAPDAEEIDLVSPPPDSKAVKVDKTGEQFVFAETAQPGLYAWRWRNAAGQSGLIGWSNVQLPQSEARLTYRPLNELVAGQTDIIAAHSLDEVRQRLNQLDQPSPQWTTPIALVLLLLCLEGLLGAMPKKEKRTQDSGLRRKTKGEAFSS